MIYSFLKVSEGGPSRRNILWALQDAGIKARFATSPYVGHVAVEVTSRVKRVQEQAARIVYGK